MRLYPKIENYHIFYRSFTQDKRGEVDAHKIKRFIKSSNRVATLHKVIGNIKNNLSQIKLNEKCAVIAPTLSILEKDVSVLERYSLKSKAQLFCNAEGTMPRNALWGYSSDVEYLGIRAAQMTFNIIINRVPIIDLPWLVLDNPVRPVANRRIISEKGVTAPSSDVVCTFDDALDYEFYARHSIAFFAPWASAFDSSLYAGIGKFVMPQRTGIDLCTNYADGWPENNVFTQRQMKELITNDDEPLLLTTGSYGTRLLQKKMLELNIFKPIISLRAVDDTDSPEPALTDSRWPQNNPQAEVCRMIIPAYRTMLTARAANILHPTAQRVGIAYTANPQKLPALLARRINETTLFFKDKKIPVLHTGTWDRTTLKSRIRELAQKVDILMWYPDFMHPCLHDFFKDLGEQFPHLFICGGDLRDITVTDIACGYDTNSLGDNIYDIAVAHLHHKKQLTSFVDLSDQRSLSQFQINPKRTEKYDDTWHGGLGELLNNAIDTKENISKKLKALFNDDIELYHGS
jgi:hypothetical protein